MPHIVMLFWGLKMRVAHWAGAHTGSCGQGERSRALPCLPCHTQLDKLQALPLGSLGCSTCRGLSLTLLSPSPQSGRQRATAVPRLSLTPASPFGRNLRMAKVWLGVRGAGVGREPGAWATPHHLVLFRQHHIFVGVPPGTSARQEHLPQVHQVDPERERHLQAGGLQSCVKALGEAEEQA